MRKVTGFSLLLAVCVISLTAGVPKGTTNAPEAGTRNDPAQDTTRPTDPPGTLDGSKNPDAIPDVVAYSLLFRFVSGRQGAELKVIRSYIRHMGLGRQSSGRCPLASEPGHQCSQPSVGVGDNDIEALLSVADDVRQHVNALDQRVKDIKDRTWPYPGNEVRLELAELQRQKEAIVTEAASSLQKKLSPGGLERLRKYVRQRVKKGTKILPEVGLPGGPDWRQSFRPAPSHH